MSHNSKQSIYPLDFFWKWNWIYKLLLKIDGYIIYEDCLYQWVFSSFVQTDIGFWKKIGIYFGSCYYQGWQFAKKKLADSDSGFFNGFLASWIRIPIFLQHRYMNFKIWKKDSIWQIQKISTNDKHLYEDFGIFSSESTHNYLCPSVRIRGKRDFLGF